MSSSARKRKPKSDEASKSSSPGPKCDKHGGSSSDNSGQQPAAGPGGVAGMTTAQIFKRTLLRVGFILGIFLVMQNYQQKGIETFAGQSEMLNRKSYGVKCSSDYEAGKYLACSPKQCGRIVMDDLVSKSDADHLLKIAKSGMAKGGSSGGATILDLHSGALSLDDKFINIYKMKGKSVFTDADFKVYVKVKNRIQQAIMKEFGVASNSLYLTKPTFFSRMTSKPAQTVHDEYWHTHVDKETYGTFYYTSLLYLADYGKDFSGGRFVFVDSDKNRTVEPRFGRVSFFTSGSENPHYVEKVESGTRYALTVSFTCDKSSAIGNPKLPSDGK